MVQGAVVVLIAGVVLYALFLAWVRLVHDRLAFPGAGLTVEPVTAADTPFGFEDLHLPVTGTTTVHAWWIPAAGGEEEAPTLLYFHGNGYALEQQAEVEAPALHETGMNLLLVDYRGYGTSSPLRTTAASTEADALAALDHLTGGRGIPPSRIWIGGRSIGSAVATRLAARSPGCAGLLLVSPLTNTVDIRPFGPVLRPLTWLGLTRAFDSRRRIAALRTPVLLLSGTADTLATPAMARALYDRAPGPKRLDLVEGAGHNDFWQVGKDQAVAAITRTVRARAASGTAE